MHGKFANISGIRIVVDIGSGGGIMYLCQQIKSKQSGKAIGIDMTDEMLEKVWILCKTER